MIEIESTSIEQTMAVGEAVGRAVRVGDVVSLSGDLGAGKTQFVRGIAAGMGVAPDEVSSPTFVIMHEYEPDDAGRPVLVHIDAYRLKDPDELAGIGWSGYGEEVREGAVVAVEWGELIRDALGPDLLEVTLRHHDAGRLITLSPRGGWRPRIKLLQEALDSVMNA